MVFGYFVPGLLLFLCRTSIKSFWHFNENISLSFHATVSMYLRRLNRLMRLGCFFQWRHHLDSTSLWSLFLLLWAEPLLYLYELHLFNSRAAIFIPAKQFSSSSQLTTTSSYTLFHWTPVSFYDFRPPSPRHSSPRSSLGQFPVALPARRGCCLLSFPTIRVRGCLPRSI